jgi:hypothetical protein
MKLPHYISVMSVSVSLTAVAMARSSVTLNAGAVSVPSFRASPRAMSVGSRGQIPAPQPQVVASGSTFRHRHRSNVNVFFVGGWSCWGPGWYGWWDYPPSYGYYDEGYQFSPSSGTPPSYVVSENRSGDYTLGFTWGLDLRLRIVTWQQFVAAVKTFYPNTLPPSREEFRRGFIAGYAKNADAVFERAVQEAVPQL